MRKQATEPETWRRPPHASHTHSTEAVFVGGERGGYAVLVLKLLSAPATNERGPRYMEKALAAIHQGSRERQPMSLEYGLHEGRVALLLRMLRSQEEFVVGPIVANYPNCSITTIEQEEPVSAGYETWTAELQLTPELFPILRHAQFEDILNAAAQPTSFRSSSRPRRLPH